MSPPQPRLTRPTFAETLERLYREQHTGPITVHFAQGVPNVIELPGHAERIPLDKRREAAQT